MADTKRRDPLRESLEAREEERFRAAVLQAFAEEAEEAAREAKTGCAEMTPERMDAMADGNEPRVLREINMALVRRARRESWRRAFSRAAQVAACAVVALGLSLTVALAASTFVRAYLGNLTLTVEEAYTEVRFNPDAEPFANPDAQPFVNAPEQPTVNVPEQWHGDYYLSYIPEGFELYDISDQESGPFSVGYRNESAKTLRFKEYISNLNTTVLFDTENATITWTQINNQTAMQSEKEGRVTLFWTSANRYFLLGYDGTVEEARRIAESIVKI